MLLTVNYHFLPVPSERPDRMMRADLTVSTVPMYHRVVTYSIFRGQVVLHLLNSSFVSLAISGSMEVSAKKRRKELNSTCY